MRSTSYAVPARLVTAGALVLSALSVTPACARAQADNRPVVVVFTFKNSSIGPDRANFDGLETGIQDLLITDLASNNKIRLVDRAHINEVLQEQNMVKSGQIEDATAIRLGKILGAQYAITGGFMSANGQAMLTSHTIDIETTAIEHKAQKLQGKTDDVLSLLSQLADQVSSDIDLAPKPGRVGDTSDTSNAVKSPSRNATLGASAGTASAASAADSVVFAKVISPEILKKTMSSKVDAVALKMYSDAIDAMDKNSPTKAITLLKQVHAKYPDFEPAARNLAKLGVTN